MVSAVILFSFFNLSLFSQCSEQFTLQESTSIQGVVSDIDGYYRNLIIQDIALSQQQAFEDISIRFEYKVNYIVDQCSEQLVEIKIRPVHARCYPLHYRGVDISNSINPEKADLVFKLYTHHGLLADSMIFFDIPLEMDSSLYSYFEMPKNKDDGTVSIGFSRAIFHYTKGSYEDFRDRILDVDRFYAASELLDSALAWVMTGFLTETDDPAVLMMNQFEIERLLTQINPSRWKEIIPPAIIDSVNMWTRFNRLLRLNTRYKTLVRNHAGACDHTVGMSSVQALVAEYIRRWVYYSTLAYGSDFRNAEFLEEISVPEITNSALASWKNRINALCRRDVHFHARLAEIVKHEFIGQGLRNETSGNQISALKYYKLAYKLSVLTGQRSVDAMIFGDICRMKEEIIRSYLEISRKTASAGNPAMAVSYFMSAREIERNGIREACNEIQTGEFEAWLFKSFAVTAGEMIDKGQYDKAIAYLEEIQSNCSSPGAYPCPPELLAMVTEARHGVYRNYLDKANQLLLRDEATEAETTLRQAIDFRIMAGYAIPRDPAERKLESIFRQAHYNDFIEEGRRNLNWEEFDIALYYFNKALMLEGDNLPAPSPELPSLRESAARQVILLMLSETRLKVWVYDFEGFKEMIAQVSGMLEEYGFGEADPLVVEFKRIQQEALSTECKKVQSEFETMMNEMMSAKKSGNYILARKLAANTVEFSLGHLECNIRDDRAWYEKVVLEPLALFQEKNDRMDNYAGVTVDEYLASYQDLRSYYYRNKLLEEGLILESFHEKVMKSEDAAFLAGVLEYYITRQSLEQGLDVLRRIRDLGVDPGVVSESQKELARLLAMRDEMKADAVEPWIILDGYVGEDKWFNDFKRSYKLTWIGESNWNIRDWPLIWKK